jgi:filamentous hemagglutinin family protein
MLKVILIAPYFIKISLIYCFLMIMNGAYAQTKLTVKSDGTLSTKVDSQESNFIIRQGTTVGENLFHSFEQFSIPNNGSVVFDNQLNIENIFTRVTGNEISQINGLIKTNGTANLFLINPNGITFGNNAQLNIGGSFIASTANQIDFAGTDDAKFSADSFSTSLLSTNIPIGLDFRGNSGKIINRSTANGSLGAGFGLEISLGKTLVLIGSDILFEGGNITSIGGRIEISSITFPAYVSLSPILQGWQLDYDNVQEFQNVSLSKGALIRTALFDKGSGDIFIRGQNILLRENSEISNTNFGNDLGGNIEIQANKLVKLSEDSNIKTVTSFGLMGTGGDIFVKTKQLIIKDEDSLIQAVNQGIGKGGNIIIEADDLIEINGEKNFNSISTGTIFFNDGISGDISIDTNKLIIKNGGFISALTEESGSGGTITIKAKFIDISSKGIDSQGDVVNSGIFSRTKGDNSIGDAGSIVINTQILQIQDEGIISVASVEGSKGNAGNLTINALESLLIRDSGSALLSTSDGLGVAGNLTIKTPILMLEEGGKISASNQIGLAGNLNITANSLFLNRSSITAETGQSGTEEGANINLQISQLLRLENESLISATANGDANGGNINIKTPLLTVFPATGANGSDIIAKAELGDGGNININAQGIFGIIEGLAIPGNQRNDIDASSEFGASGQVEISSTTDPNRGVIQLPEAVVDPNALVAQNPCKRGSQSQFTRSGRGGLPPSINEDLNGEATQVGLVAPATSNSAQQETKKVEDNSESSPSEITPIIPTQGWIFNDKGEVVLVAYDPTSMTETQRLKEKIPGCPVPE